MESSNKNKEVLSKQDVVNSLLKYLPTIAKSLSQLVSYLQGIINKEEMAESVVCDILDNVVSLHETVRTLMSSMNISNKEVIEVDKEILDLYLLSIKNLLDGIELMLEWIDPRNETDGDLTKAIDTLFLSSQQVVKLVNKIVDA